MATKDQAQAGQKLEKQKLYQQAFEQDVRVYKATGLIASEFF